MILGIDQGTSGTMCIAFDDRLGPVAQAYRELPNHYPRPGWVEQDPEDIVATVVTTVAQVLAAIGGPRAVTAVGLANQGETVVAWDGRTGEALGPALVWSDGRAEASIARLRDSGHADRIPALSGLRLDPYFSAAKLAWLLANEPLVQRAATASTLRLGTVDTWLAWRLGGNRMLTDHSTASRTQLMGLGDSSWHPELLEIFGVPRASLASVQSSLGDWGELGHEAWGGTLRWRASIVDQPAALAGNACFAAGDTKATYGTGCFVLVNAGTDRPSAPEGLLPITAWSRGGRHTFALDGGAFTAGTAMNWLSAVGIVPDPRESAELAESVHDTAGVRFLPAITGFGAPWWHQGARGVFSGITAGTTRGHLTRAVLDAIAFRVRDIIEALSGAGVPTPSPLHVDGGLSKNRYLMQRQADVLGTPVERSANVEATATGAAALAAIADGLLTQEDVRSLLSGGERFEPELAADAREAEYADWLVWLDKAFRL